MGRRAIPIDPYIEKLVQAVSLGATYELAARFAGVSEKTFERWRLAADTAPAHSALGRLHLRLLTAEGQSAVRWLAQIEQAAQAGDWRAAAWKLERRYPEIYGPRVQASLRVQAQQAAQEVADELGIDVRLVLQEANDYLLEHRRGGPS